MIQTVPLKLVTTGLNKALSDLLANIVSGNYTGLLGKTYLGLYTAPFPGFSLNLLASGLTEAAFNGYARVAATWSVKGTDPSGRAEVFSQGVLWNPTSAGTASTILGIALYDALTAGNLYGIGILPTSITLATVTDMATLVARFALPLDNADWGQSVFTN